MANQKTRVSSTDPLNKIISLVKGRTQVDLSHYKVSTIKRRVERQMRLKKLSDLAKYARYLTSHPEAIVELYEDVFIHVTEFFRDPESYEALKKTVFPALVKGKNEGDSIRLWVAGCATGEEAYSLAILLTEYLHSKKLSLTLKIIATDISPMAIQFARRAVYPESSLAKVSSKKVLSHFEKNTAGYKVKKEIRDMVLFSQHDLLSNPPFSNVDLITCRNVLIYFSPEVQKKIFPLFNFGLRRDGFLWLGPSESTGVSSQLFRTLDKKHRLFQKLPHAEDKRGREPLYRIPILETPVRSPARKRRNSTKDESDEMFQELDTLFEQFESGQEELMSSNEELQSANEELTAANEELETAKEELQCTNEELSVANSELEARNNELFLLNEQLRASEERFRLMVSAVKDYAIFMLDPNGKVVSWNEGARRFKGYEAEEIIGKHFSTFYTDEDKKRHHPEYELKRAIAEGHYEEEGWRVRKDGSHFWSSVVITKLTDSAGRLLGFSKVTRDLTEKREAMERIRRSEERFRLMVNSVKDYAIFMLDPEGRVASWNEGAHRLKGYTSEEIIGKHFSTFYTEPDKLRNHPAYELKVATRDGRYEEEGWRLKKDGSRFWANVVITRVNDEAGNILGFAKVTRDLSERKKSEENLREAYAGLEKRVEERTKELQEALKSRDEFLSIASHELKTPLTSLKLQLQISNKRIEKDEGNKLGKDLQKSLSIGVRQVDSLTSLVDDLLDVSRIQTGVFSLDLKEVTLSQLVEDVAAKYTEALAQAKSFLTLRLDRTIVGHWDEHRIEQVIVNLVYNAIKYAPGAPITVSTYKKDKNTACLEVIDQGPGIAAERIEMVFNRFERGNAPNSIGGLGLGLFIVKKIVEHHRGSIRVESTLGKGARFIVELPTDL